MSGKIPTFAEEFETQTTMKVKIKNVTLLNEEDYTNREVLVTLDNGTEVHIAACHESWEQWGGSTDEMYVTMPVAERLNEWLHPYNAENFYPVAKRLCEGLDRDVYETAQRLAEIAQENGWNVAETDDLCFADSVSMFDIIEGCKGFDPADFE